MTCFSILFELAKANSAGVSDTGGYAQVRNYSIEMDRKNINVSSLVAVAQDVTPLLRIAMSASVVPSPSVRNYSLLFYLQSQALSMNKSDTTPKIQHTASDTASRKPPDPFACCPSFKMAYGIGCSRFTGRTNTTISFCRPILEIESLHLTTCHWCLTLSIRSAMS